MTFDAMGVRIRDLVLSFTRKKQVVEISYTLHKNILIIICILSGKKKATEETEISFFRDHHK